MEPMDPMRFWKYSKYWKCAIVSNSLTKRWWCLLMSVLVVVVLVVVVVVVVYRPLREPYREAKLK